MTIKLSNGITTATIETITVSTPGNSTWVSKSHQISSYLTPTNNMRIIITVNDIPAGHISEGAFDRFEITDGLVGLNELNRADDVNIFPNPFDDEINIQFNKIKNSSMLINVTDVMGRVLNSYSEVNTSNIKISNNYNKGIYLVNIFENGVLIKSQKLIKY